MRDAWRNVWLLGAVSLLNDISGEMVMAVLPFLLVAQGAGGLAIGIVGGVTEGLGHAMKLAGGWLDERLRRPRLAIASGYLTASLSRFGVALAGSWGATLAFRSLDRVGKGLRTAPRDAWLAAQVPPPERARAFAVHRALDTAGAFLGVVAVLAGLAWGVGERDLVLAGAFVGLLALAPLPLLRGDAALRLPAAARHEPRSPNHAAFVATTCLYYLGRVTYLLFILRAAQAPGGAVGAVAGYLVFNGVYAAGAYPAAKLAERHGQGRALVAGFLLGGVASAAFLLPPTTLSVQGGFVLLGVSFALVEGNARAVAAGLAGSEGRSTQFGVFHAATGLATLLGGVAAGALWDRVSPGASFAFGAALAVAAALLMARLAGREPLLRPGKPLAAGGGA